MTRWTARDLVTTVGEFRLGPVDLEISEGEAIAVIGRSGAGKTTLLRTIAGLVGTSHGRIERDGTDVTDRPPEERGIGYVPQGLGLFPHRTVEGNVRFPLDIAGGPNGKERIAGLLERFGLSSLARRRPSELSTGEQQRVAIARALAARPRLLLWDEPLVSLDVAARDDLLEALRAAQSEERLPIVLVTHDASIAFSLAGRFLVLDRGRVAFSGSAGALLHAPVDGFVARFLGFANVYGWSDLHRTQAGPFARWLAERAGPEGVCFASSRTRPSAGPDTRFRAKVQWVEPIPDGVALRVDAEGLPVQLVWTEERVGSLPAAGQAVDFSIDESGLRPLGGPPSAVEAGA